MYNRNKDKQKVFFYGIILIILLIIGIVINIFIKDRKITIFEKAIKDSFLTVEQFFSAPIDAFKKNNCELQENKYKLENEELKKQLEELKKIHNIPNTLNDYEIISAVVVSRDLSSWKDIITINKGEKDGIEIGNAVVIENNLIGKVISTSLFNSTVRLLTATDVVDKISVKIKDNDKYVYGILNKNDNKFIIEGLPSSLNISNGTYVTTTGMGNIYPAGVILGEVVESKKDNFDLSNVLEINSLIDFNNINYVNVLKRHV